MPARKSAFVPIEHIAQSILLLRGQRVILDHRLAIIYGVQTRALNQAVKRNIERFPADFAFRLTRQEADFSRSQSVILNASRGQNINVRFGAPSVQTSTDRSWPIRDLAALRRFARNTDSFGGPRGRRLGIRIL
jgi:hypothetical protein